MSVLSPTDSVLDCIPYKSQIQFNLKDVNTFLYSVKFTEIQRDNISGEAIENKDLNILFSPNDYQIGELKFSDFLLPDPQKSQLVKTLDDFEICIQVAQSAIIQYNNLLSELNKNKDDLVTQNILKIEKKYENNNDTISKKLEIISLSINPTEDTGLPALFKKIDSIKKAIHDSTNSINSNSRKRDTFLSTNKDDNLYITRFSSQLINYIKAVNKVNEKVEFYRSLLFLLFSNEPFDKIKSDKEKLSSLYMGNGIDQSSFIRNCNLDFDNIDTIYYGLLLTYSSLNNRNQIAGSLLKLNNFHSSLDKSKYQELFNQILKTYNAINEVNWSVNYQTTRIADKADKVFYDIELVPIINDYSLAKKPIKLNYDFDIKGGVKIDFSAGLFFHYNLYDDQYKFVKLSDTSKQVVKENNAYDFIPNLGVLFNLYFRSTSSIKPTVNIGVGTNVEKLYYYLGLGVLIGKSERIGIHGGLVGGTVKRISNEYKNGQVVYQSIDMEPTVVPMQSKDPFQMGLFIGFSYNLTGKNEEKMNSLLLKK